MSVTFFEYAKIGIPLLLLTAVFFALLGPKLVPAKDSAEAAKYAPKAGLKIGGRGWFTLATLVLTVGAMIAADYVKCLPPMLYPFFP